MIKTVNHFQDVHQLYYSLFFSLTSKTRWTSCESVSLYVYPSLELHELIEGSSFSQTQLLLLRMLAHTQPWPIETQGLVS